MLGVKLPQPYGLRLEMIRAKGFTDAETIELLKRNNETELLAAIHSEINWEGFIAYNHEHGELLKAAVLDGYQFSFITIGGIKNLLSIKFNKHEGADYEIQGSFITKLKLSEADFLRIRLLVPKHWKLIVSSIHGATTAEFVEVGIELEKA
ncbi:hypothetical protein GK047_03205 [Paenibacillus sp. SYP-B3998]|uniref:Uncharacterized protein n=1 Tax=Paenibacillus sp. SYP-B3998 TaxID=2678564 RepID=A0A6G3ZUD5_9BACL|nr:hypothetical protein [Paenibacillus sp. SYP-B3998]NEW05027.1 hypothetical protein [Paenibacillus sp. SYP-B3998]